MIASLLIGWICDSLLLVEVVGFLMICLPKRKKIERKKNTNNYIFFWIKRKKIKIHL